jgi:hypothetical protein
MTRYTGGATVVGGSGPNPSDTFSLGIKMGDTNVVPSDAMSVAFAFPDTIAGQTDLLRLGLSLADTNPALSDLLLRLGFGLVDTNLAPSDVAAYAFGLTLAESNAAPTDLLRLAFTLPDVNALPTDAATAVATWRQGATTAVGSGSGWTNAANAQGLNNATLATSADTSALAAWTSALALDPYPDPDTSFSTWTIGTVKIYEYAKYTPGTLPAAGSWQLQYRLGTGTYSIAESINTVFDSKATPKVFDITATKPGGGAWTWADVNNLNTNVVYNSALAETSSAEVDAVLIEVVATSAL